MASSMECQGLLIISISEKVEFISDFFETIN